MVDLFIGSINARAILRRQQQRLAQTAIMVSQDEVADTVHMPNHPNPSPSDVATDISSAAPAQGVDMALMPRLIV